MKMSSQLQAPVALPRHHESVWAPARNHVPIHGSLSQQPVAIPTERSRGFSKPNKINIGEQKPG
jgi:hypothetical protein